MNRFVTGLFVFHGGIAAAIAGCSSTSTEDAPEAAGRVDMRLTVAAGVTLSTLDWTISDGNDRTVLSSDSEGQRPWRGGAASAINLVIGGVRTGGPYRISLNGVTSNGESCNGSSQEFSVRAGAISDASVNVQCAIAVAGTPVTVESGSVAVSGTVTTVAGSSVECPGIEQFSVSPSQIAGTDEANLRLTTTGPAPTRVTWSASAGTVRSPNATETAFTCGGFVGTAQITATVESVSSCAGQPNTSQTTTIICEAGAAGTSSENHANGAPGSSCSNNSDCASFQCEGQICSAYASSCRSLADRSAPPGSYTLDTDGSGPNSPFVTYCQTGSPTLPEAGLCQSASAAPPSCRSYVGSVGYDFVGVDFGGSMSEAGWLEWQGQAILAGHDITELGNGTFLSNAFTSWCCWGSATTPNRYPVVGGAQPFGTGISDAWGFLSLLDGRVVIGGTTQVSVLSQDGTSQQTLRSTASLWPVQTQTGRILLPSRSVNQIIQLNSEGTLVTDTSHPAFLPGNVDSAVQLADGSIVVAVAGNNTNSRLVFFERDMSPRVFTRAPSGMTLNADGSLTRSDLLGVGAMLQLPNSQILVAVSGANTIARLNADGSYVDSFALPSTWTSPTGITLDHRGRLLVAVESTHQIHVVTFPGCSDGRRSGTESDIDCGGVCSRKCQTSQLCVTSSDCAGEQCNFGVCQ